MEVSTKLSEEFGDGVEVVLIDRNDGSSSDSRSWTSCTATRCPSQFAIPTVTS